LQQAVNRVGPMAKDVEKELSDAKTSA